MSVKKKIFIAFIVGAVLGLLSGFFIGKGIYDQPITESVTRDTVTRIDTVFQNFPKPAEVEKVRTEYRWLTKVVTENVGAEKFSVDSVSFSAKIPQDSVLVEVPIESKHYNAPEYDAWVSGYQPSLDSIRVYNETQVITETITITKPPNKLSLAIIAGIDYGTTSRYWQPYASGELTLNNHKRLQLGIEGGVKKNEVTSKFDPFVGIKGKIRIF